MQSIYDEQEAINRSKSYSKGAVLITETTQLSVLKTKRRDFICKKQAISNRWLQVFSQCKMVTRSNEACERAVYLAVARCSLVVVVGYLTPSEEWGHGGRPWSPRSRATLQGLDQRS